MNSFAVGRRSDSAIAITHGMLRHLSMRELMAVLAHEVSHIAGNDIWVMQIADMITRMTRMMALIGIAVGLLSLPLAMFGGGNLPFLPLLALIIRHVILFRPLLLLLGFHILLGESAHRR